MLLSYFVVVDIISFELFLVVIFQVVINVGGL